MPIADSPPIRTVSKHKYGREGGQRLTVKDIWNEDGQYGEEYIARFIKERGDDKDYAADYWVEIKDIKIPRKRLFIPDLLSGCVKITLLPLTETGQALENQPEKRIVHMDGTIHPRGFRALPLFNIEAGYFLNVADDIDEAITELYGAAITPRGGGPELPYEQLEPSNT